MNTLAAPKVALKLVPVPKPVLYAGMTGELLKNTGMQNNQQIQAIQQAVSEGLIESVVVAAMHGDGRVEEFTLTIKPFSATETVNLHLENGKSYLEALDVGLAAAVQYAANLIARQGITPTFKVSWSARARASPAIIAEALKRLNLKVLDEPTPPAPAPAPYVEEWVPPPSPPTPPQRFPQTVRTYTGPPPPPQGHTYKTVLTITPEKDPGVSFSYRTTRKTAT